MWVADREKGFLRITGGQIQNLGPPGAALCGCNGRVFCAGERQCLCCDHIGQPLFDFPLPPGVCAMERLGNRICALSSDADCLCVYDAADGAPVLSLPAGVFPRALASSPCGRYLAIAGGAAGEVWVLDQDFFCVQQYRVAGVAVDVCFLPRCLAVLCAVGESQLNASLVCIRPSGVQEERMRWDAAPCCLCPWGTNGGLLAGCHGEVCALRSDGSILFRLPCPYPCRIRPGSQGPLICDSWQGAVLPLRGPALYIGQEPADVLDA